MMKKKVNIFIYIFLMIGVLLIVYPMILTVITSLKTPQELSRSFFALPERLMLDNFISILTDSEYPRTILNTLVITIFSSLGVVLFIPMVSYAIARNMKDKKYYKYLYFFLLMGIFVPFTVKMLPLIKVMSMMNMLNIFGLIVVYVASAVCEGVFLYVAFIQGIPTELEEAAYIDGASTFTTYYKIIFPLLAPMTSTVLIKNGLWFWNDFLLPLLALNKSPDNWTLTLFQYNFKTTHAVNYPMVFAAFLLSMLPVMVFYAFMQKQIIGAQKAAEQQSKPYNDRIAALEREVKEFVTEHRDEMGKAKSKTLTFGEVGFRISTSISLPRAKEKLEEIIRKLKARQMTDCIVVKEEVSKEALKKYGEDTVNAVGATWKQKDVFGYDLNLARLEQIKSGA